MRWTHAFRHTGYTLEDLQIRATALEALAYGYGPMIDFEPGIAWCCAICGRGYVTGEAKKGTPASTRLQIRGKHEIEVSFECFSCTDTDLADVADLTGLPREVALARASNPEA